jgi:hypothetical protein
MFTVLESDDLRLALYIQSSIHPVYLQYSHDGTQSTSQILKQYQENGKKDCTIFVIIIRAASDPAPAGPRKTKREKKTTKGKEVIKPGSRTQEPDIKQKPAIQEPDIKQESTVRGLTKKRSWSVALKELDEILADEDQVKLEENKDSDTLPIPTEEHGIAYRTRRRHIIQPEDVKRSAEYGIPI